MIDHVSVGVTDIERAGAFYDTVLGTLGHRRLFDFGMVYGYGSEPSGPHFWVGQVDGARGGGGVHIAFAAPDRAAVDAFHRAALAAGATDNGAPGPRPHYHPDYYGAFVIDGDGNRLEAVCHRPA